MKIIDNIGEAKAAAQIMSESDPWITLGRGYDECLKIFLDKSNDCYVDLQGATIIAFIVVTTVGPFSPYIKSLGVHPEYRNRGIGSGMIAGIETIYSNSKHIFIGVSSFNDKAKALYEKRDYKVVAQIPGLIIEGHSELLMMKSLAKTVSNDVDEDLVIKTRKEDMNIDYIYAQLKNSYWALEITREDVIARVLNSICFGVFIKGKQIGFARVITDYNSFAYLADVFIDERERGKGYSKTLMKHVLSYPVLKDKKWLLATRDAHGLYEKFGFTAMVNPERFMGMNGWKGFNRQSP